METLAYFLMIVLIVVGFYCLFIALLLNVENPADSPVLIYGIVALGFAGLISATLSKRR